MEVQNIKYKRWGINTINYFIGDEKLNYIVEIEAKFIKNNVVELANFIIRKEEYSGQGYGSFLFKETLRKLKELGVKEIYLTACASFKTKGLKQSNLISFYESNGFKKRKLRMSKDFKKEHECNSYYSASKLWKEKLSKEVPMILQF